MSPSFAALVRKERYYLLALFLLASAAHWLVFATHGFGEVFVVPRGTWAKDSLALTFPLALLAGVLAGLREHLSRTREFLWHRPISPSLPVLARGLAGSFVLFAAPYVGAGVVFLDDWFGPSGGVGAELDALAFFAVVGACTVALYWVGLSAFARGASWAALVAWISQGLMLYGLHIVLDALEAGLLVRAAAMLCAGALPLAAAVQLASAPADPDRPTARRWLVLPLALVTLGAAVAGNLAMEAWQIRLFRALTRHEPGVGLTPGDELVLTRYDWESGRWDIVDQSGLIVGELDDDQPRINPPSPPGFSASLLAGFFLRSDRFRTCSLYFPNRVRTFAFDREARRLRVIDTELRGANRPRRFHELRLEDGDSFPAELEFMTSELLLDDEGLVVVDPRGQRLWLIDGSTPPVLQPLPLPRGETPTGLETVWVRSSDDSQTSLLTLRSQTTNWQLLDGAWSEVLDYEPALGILLREQSADPLHPRILVEAPDGKTLAHSYLLDTLSKKCTAGLVGLLTAARPPILALGAVLLDPRPLAERPRQSNARLAVVNKLWGQLTLTPDSPGSRAQNARMFFVDRMLSSDYGWLFPLSLALHALLAALVARDLARRGADRARILAWCAALLVAGIWVCPLLALTETRRVWKKSRSGPAPAPLVLAA